MWEAASGGDEARRQDGPTSRAQKRKSIRAARSLGRAGPGELRSRGWNPKCEGSAAGGLEFAEDRRHVTQRPLPPREEDVAGVRAAPGLGPALGAVPRDPSLQWGRGRLLHSGPEPRAPHARVLLLRGPPGPAFPGRLQNEEFHHLLQRPAVPGHLLLPPETQPQRALRGLLPLPLALWQGAQLPALRRPARGLHASAGRRLRDPAPFLLRRWGGPGRALRAGAPAAAGRQRAPLPPRARTRGRRGPGALRPGLRAQRLLRVRARRVHAALARTLAGPPPRPHHGPSPAAARCSAALSKPAPPRPGLLLPRRCARATRRARQCACAAEGRLRPAPRGAVRGAAAARARPTAARGGVAGPPTPQGPGQGRSLVPPALATAGRDPSARCGGGGAAMRVRERRPPLPCPAQLGGPGAAGSAGEPRRGSVR